MGSSLPGLLAAHALEPSRGIPAPFLGGYRWTFAATGEGSIRLAPLFRSTARTKIEFSFLNQSLMALATTPHTYLDRRHRPINLEIPQ
jgi:hypothetical protein